MHQKSDAIWKLLTCLLDVVCCGFGAVILLLVITKIYEPISIQESKVNMEELVVELERQLNELKG